MRVPTDTTQKIITFITLPVNLTGTFLVADHEEPRPTMYTRFTDAENTGAPMVPIAQEEDVAADGGTTREELEEVVLSHRIQE
ncbi:MAG: hypothetical protein ACI9CA_001923 [Natronomonas sp.]